MKRSTLILAAAVLLSTPVQAEGPADVAGTWDLSIRFGETQRQRQLQLVESGGQLSGTWTSDETTVEASDIAYLEGVLSFLLQSKTERGSMEMVFEARLVDGQLRGKLRSFVGPIPFVGTRSGAAPASRPATAPAATPARTGPGELRFEAANDRYQAQGQFESWRFTSVEIPDGNLEQGHITIEVDLASVSEKAEKLAAHLRNSDFFDVDVYPTAIVSIDGAKKTGKREYEAQATVTMHGATAAVPLSFTVITESPLRIYGTATLSRGAFGIGQPYDPKAKGSINDDVTISLRATLP